MQKQVSHLQRNRKRTVMENELQTNTDFTIENCQAENTIKDWVDCLSPDRAYVCGFSIRCGNGYSCEHPRRFRIVQITKKLNSKLIFPPNSLKSDNQE